MWRELDRTAVRPVAGFALSLALTCGVAFAASAAPRQTMAPDQARSGKSVTEAVCVECHAKGVNGAPVIGDRKAWAARTARGLTGLTHSALQGVRKMPAHGGSPGLSNLEIERAIIYMVNKSGGRWTEPISRTARPAERTGEQIVHAECSKCHEAGVGGAPLIGDHVAWAPRASQGFDVLVRSAINGHGGMPARGGLVSLADGQIAAAIAYMLSPVVATAEAPVAAAGKLGPNDKVIDGMEIHFGAMSADALRKQNAGKDAAGAAPRAIPSGDSYYYLNISLFDAATRSAIKDAYVEARIADPVMGDQVRVLEPTVLNDTTSYGNYFRLAGKSARTVAVLVRKPGEWRATEAKFGVGP